MPFGAKGAGAIGVGWCMLLGNVLAIVLFARATGIRGILGRRTIARVAAGAGVTAVLMLAVAPTGGPAAIATMLGAWGVGSAIASLPVLARLVRP